MTNYQMILCEEDKRNAGYIDEVQTMEITENGEYSFRPGEGYQGLAGVDVSVEIPEKKMKVGGMKFAYSSEVDTTKYDWSDVEDFSYMFANYSGVDAMDLTDVVTSKATDTSNMFNGAKILQFINELNKVDTSNVTNMTGMFGNMDNLWFLSFYSDTSKVTIMSGMFSGCKNMTDLYITSLNTSNVNKMINMFYNCNSLTSLDLSSFNTSKVTDMSGMFNSCSGLTSLDLSGFDVGNVSRFNIMFQNCSKLASLDLSNFNMNSAASTSNMFYGCKALTEVKVINCNDSTKQKILTQLQKDLSSYTWTLGDDGIIRRS